MSKITKIEAQKRNKERVNIYIDDEYAFSTFLEIVYKEGLHKDLIIDTKKYSEIIKKENIQKCKNTSLRIIERSHKTEQEMRKRLFEKEYNEEEINIAIDFLKEYKFLDDNSYTNLYINEKIKSYGGQKIKYSLLSKGITKEVIDKALQEVTKEEFEEAALKLAEKKYRILLKRENNKYNLYNKLYRYLVSRGYDYELSKSITKGIVEMD